MKIALIEVPDKPMTQLRWEDVYFPETPFPICDFLNHEQNQVQIWDLRDVVDLDTQRLIHELQSYQPVVIGINDRQTTNGLVLERLIKQLFPRMLVFFSADAMALEQLLDKANQQAFSLRNSTKAIAGKLRLYRTWDEEELFEVLPDAAQRAQAQAIEAEFHHRYQLDLWKQSLPAAAYRKNLYMLEILESTFPEDSVLWQREILRILDSGPGNWVYAPAIYQFFRHAYAEKPRKVYLTGVELDPYRVDQEGYSSVDYALSYVDPIASHCRYLIQDLLDYQPRDLYDVALQMLPFVLPDAHLFWGLPARFFRPGALIQHIHGLLKPEGVLLVANEIAPEYEMQLALFEELGLKPYISGAFYSEIRRSPMGFVSAVQKAPD